MTGNFKNTYIASSYVKFVEMAGARAIPIQADLTVAELDILFEKINGLLIPGGATDLVNQE